MNPNSPLRLIDRVRTRLLAAFVVLLAAAIALALLGWFGMGSAQRALEGFQGEVLPNVTRALELAERTAKLAAIAPSVAESRTPEALALNVQATESLLDEIRGRVGSLPAASPLSAELGQLLADIGRDLGRLHALTRELQASQQSLHEQLSELDRMAGALPSKTISALFGQPSLAAVWSDLVVGAGSDSPATLGRLEADVEALWIAARRKGGLADPPTSFIESLSTMSQGPGNVLETRRAQLELERRSAYLVVLTRGNADQLSADVGQYVTSLREQAATRRTEVQQGIRAGEMAMLLLAAGSLLIGALATRYVRRLASQIEVITADMSRLAQGDTSRPAHPMPPLRGDELGALVRSFHVFREALLAKQALLVDLHTQGALLDAVHENMTDALAVFDRNGALLLWNRRFADLLGRYRVSLHAGLSLRGLLGGLPTDATWLVPGQTVRLPLAALEDASQVDPFDLARHDQIELHLPDAGVYDLRSRRMPDGGSVTLATDLTARRAIESQVQHAHRLEVLGQLTGGVAHDFNNHLGTIIGNLGLVADDAGLQPGARTQLQRARRAAASAAALTRRLLAFARRQPLDAERVAIDGMIEEMRDLIEYSAGDHTAVELRLEAGAAQVHVDRGHLENALLNLVLNSAAAMPGGGVLSVSTRIDAGGAQGFDAGRAIGVDGSSVNGVDASSAMGIDASSAMGVDASVEIRIADNGSGIPEHLLDRVFEPFFTTKALGEGSGLGLSGVYGFVKQSGGDITLSSRLGVGTTFSLRLPLASAERVSAASGGSSSRSVAGAIAGSNASADSSPGTSALKDVLVLVVDDDEAFRNTLVDMLAAVGARAVVAADAAMALTRLGQHGGIDLVLTDVGLGSGIDGLALARAIRQARPRLPVCLMSGLPFERLMQRADWDAGLGLLSKPFEAEALAAQWRVLRKLPAMAS